MLRAHRGLIALSLAAALVLAAAAIAIVYVVIFPTSSPAKLALASAASTPSPTASDTGTGSGVAGSWRVGSGSQAGYRVRETLAFVGAPSDAVGRTSSVQGTLTLSQSASTYMLSAASLIVDVNTLTSDRAMRDQRIHSMGLQSNQYPKATFVLSSPVALPATAGNGQAFTVNAPGQLTIHGASRSVTIPIQARVTGAQIEVAGSLTFPFSEFGMTPPSIGGFVSVENDATMEFAVNFVKAA